jgi:hypothetical protein
VQDDKFLARYIETNPHYPTPDEARVKEYGVSVWALIAHLHVVDGDVARVARDYVLPKEAVEAALGVTAQAYQQGKHALVQSR